VVGRRAGTRGRPPGTRPSRRSARAPHRGESFSGLARAAPAQRCPSFPNPPPWPAPDSRFALAKGKNDMAEVARPGAGKAAARRPRSDAAGAQTWSCSAQPGAGARTMAGRGGCRGSCRAGGAAADRGHIDSTSVARPPDTRLWTAAAVTARFCAPPHTRRRWQAIGGAAAAAVVTARAPRAWHTRGKSLPWMRRPEFSIATSLGRRAARRSSPGEGG